jgi:hypothetical protein
MKNIDTKLEALRSMLRLIDDPTAFARFNAESKRAAEQRRARHAHKWAAMLHHVTPEQVAQINALRALGAKAVRLYQDRTSRNAAVMMQRRPVFDTTRSRMGCKLYMIYPDGSRVETFEKSISIQQSF